MAPLRLRYIVILDAATREVGRGATVDFDRGVWGVGSEWTRVSELSAAVLDVTSAQQSGTVGSQSWGKAGFVVPFVLVIPLPPIPWSSFTESRACNALGPAIATFVAGEEEKHVMPNPPEPNPPSDPPVVPEDRSFYRRPIDPRRDTLGLRSLPDHRPVIRCGE
jgi:hypothetical protein